MANLQRYIKEDTPSDNPEATMNDTDESKDTEDINLIVSQSSHTMIINYAGL